MKALVLNSFGVAPVLQTVDTPVPQAGQVLIKLKGSGLNPLDVKIMAGEAKHAQTKLPAIIGVDGSGIVEAVGEGRGHALDHRLPVTGGDLGERLADLSCYEPVVHRSLPRVGVPPT